MSFILLTFLVMDMLKYLNQKKINGELSWKDIYKIEELCAIFLLVDIRHEPTNDDVMMYEWIKHFGYNCVVIATKADKISRGVDPKTYKHNKKKITT